MTAEQAKKYRIRGRFITMIVVSLAIILNHIAFLRHPDAGRRGPIAQRLVADGHHPRGVFSEPAVADRSIHLPTVTDTALLQQRTVTEIEHHGLIVRLFFPGFQFDRLDHPPAPAHDRSLRQIDFRRRREHYTGRFPGVHRHDLPVRRGRLRRHGKSGPGNQKPTAVESPVTLKLRRIIKLRTPGRIRRGLRIVGYRRRLRRRGQRSDSERRSQQHPCFHTHFLLISRLPAAGRSLQRPRLFSASRYAR